MKNRPKKPDFIVDEMGRAHDVRNENIPLPPNPVLKKDSAFVIKHFDEIFTFIMGILALGCGLSFLFQSSLSHQLNIIGYSATIFGSLLIVICLILVFRNINRMDKIIRKLVNVDIDKTFYITRNEIGKEIPVLLDNKQYMVKIPSNFKNNITQNFPKLGKKQLWLTGDLFLHIWLNQGEDIYKNVWVSDTLARKGTEIVLQLEYERIKVKIPQNSRNGITIKIGGLGEKPVIDIGKPPPKITRGDLYLLVYTYPEYIFSIYGSFDNLSTEAMALEGWIYIHIDDIKHKLRSKFPWKKEMKSDYIVNEFNSYGYKGIFNYLREYLDLQSIRINIEQSDAMMEPGRCETRIMTQGGMIINSSHKIFINKAFTDDPFISAAILSHELCHVVYSEFIGEKSVRNATSQIDVERSVDLLVFLFNLGEFQLRVARDMRLSLGYFNQDNFERMITIIQQRGYG